MVVEVVDGLCRFFFVSCRGGLLAVHIYSWMSMLLIGCLVRCSKSWLLVEAPVAKVVDQLFILLISSCCWFGWLLTLLVVGF